ncbi:death-inducer obliterator 1-like [Watersipora subatra]|uniref:death-inducer obliterator 1-like n=1 Tax=Watersipora subatra TaxID=2589382 RepID=UPI00355B79E6
MKKQSVSEDAVESEAIVKTPDGSGWIPGKIKVIDRKSGSSEKAERLRRKSQELKRRLSSAAEDLFKPDEPADKKTRREKAKQTLRDDEVSGGETGSSSEEEDADDAEWKEEDDPDRLWCVCRKPHDNRFMICCDRCEEWYHGDCVGISRKRGTQMETENEEYICSQCKEKELVEQLGGVEKLSEPSSLLVTSSVTTSLTPSTPETTADGKPMIKLQGEIRKKKANTSGAEKRKKFAVFPVQTPRQHCIGSGCDNWAEENKIYCSLNCIIKHANESLDIINKEKSKTVGPKHESGKVSADLVVMERHTGRLVTGAHAPVPDNLISWLTKHPSYEVLRPGQQMGHVSSSSSFYGKKKSKLLSSSEDKSQKRTSSAKEEDAGTAPKKSTGPDPAAIRSNVKKSMVDALKERLKETSDSKTKEDEIKSIAASIEHELYKLYGETNSKYKSRFRSLVFNIKDPKNKGLFRKILRKKLKPSKLVRMTPDELASKELHQWREKEMQSELEKIKADEERKAAIKPLLRKITHKGEIEVEQDTYKDLDTKLEESLKDYDMTKFSGDHHTSEKTSDQSISEHSVDLLSSIMESGDTTPQHDAHLFDSNCKICIGKQAAPSKADLEKASNRVKVSHEVSRSAIRSSKESSKEELDKSIKNELEDLEKEIKIFEAEDKIIAEKLAKRRHSHQDTKKRVRVQENNSPGDEPAARTHSPGTPPLPDLSSPTPVVKKRGSTPSAWKGFIDAPEISCKFFTTAHGVHGNSDCLKTDLPDSLQIVGRIHPNQVWEYIGQLRHTLSREVILIRFSAVNEEEKASYKVYFKYLSEKKRFGVVGNGSSDIKDMYIIPLPSHESLPVALKPYRHKVLADDNRPNMLVGLVVRTKLKRTGSQDPLYGSKKSKSDEDEPYEPPGIDELLPAEPETPSPMTTPNNAEPFDIKNVEEYDPSQPLVSLSVGNSQEGQEENEMYDPIVSAYSLADPKTLNAEDVPGAAPYSPGENDAEDGDEAYDPGSLPIAITPSQSEPLPHKSPSTNPYRIAAPLPAEPSEPYDPMDTLNAKSPPMPREPYNPMRTSPPAPDKPYNPAAALSRAFPSHPEELYDPAAPLSPQKSGRDQSSSSHASISLLMDSDLTAQQRALKELTAQVELQKKQLHKARLAQQILPMQSETVSHQLVSGQSSQLLTSSTTDISQTEITKQFLTQSIESKNTPVAPPVLATPKESNLDPNIPIAESERPKISFSFSGIRNVSHSSQFQNNESTNHSGPPPPQNKVPLLAPPPPPVSLSSNNLLSPASHRPLLSDPRVASGPDQTHSRDRYPGGANDPDQTHCSDRYSGGANGPDQTHSRDGFPGGASGPDQTHSRNRYSGGADGPDQTHSKDGFPRGASGPGQTHSRDGLPRGASGPGRILIRDEDMGQRDFRENYGDRRGWQDSYDGRAHWRAPPPSRDAGYRQGMPGEYDYHNRNRRGGYGQGPDERYHRDY